MPSEKETKHNKEFIDGFAEWFKGLRIEIGGKVIDNKDFPKEIEKIVKVNKP